jgi:hypothetical protein
MAFTIKVNGVDRTADVYGDMPLLWVLCDVFARLSSAAERKRISLVMPPAGVCDVPIQIEHLP